MNKGIYLKTADIYLRFPEIMEEECNDLAEFLEDEHIVYEGATDIVYNLQQENQRLKEIEKEHRTINGELRVENKELQEKYMKLEDKYIHNVPCCNEEDCDLFCEHQELKDRIDKAVEYINGQKYFDCNYNPEAPWDWKEPKHDLLEILKGDKK